MPTDTQSTRTPAVRFGAWLGIFSRRKRWEREVIAVLDAAENAARKLRIEYQRGSVEPKAEYDVLINAAAQITKLRQGSRMMPNNRITGTDHT